MLPVQYATFEISYRENGIQQDDSIVAVIIEVNAVRYEAVVREIFNRKEEQLLLIDADLSVKANFIRIPLEFVPGMLLKAADANWEYPIGLSPTQEPIEEGVCYRIGVVREGDKLFASIKKVDQAAGRGIGKMQETGQTAAVEPKRFAREDWKGLNDFLGDFESNNAAKRPACARTWSAP